MMVQMLGVFAEFERATIIDRVIAGMERKAVRGGWLGGTIPFGYRRNPETDTLEPRETEAPLVPVIFDLYVNKRLGCRAVANWLNESGSRTREGRLWSHMTTMTVLRNEAYLGRVNFRGKVYQGTHPPLVEEELFQAAQTLMHERGDNYSRRRSNASDYLLGGLLTCAHCGSKFIGTAARGNRYQYRYYTCHRRNRYGPKGCPSEATARRGARPSGAEGDARDLLRLRPRGRGAGGGSATGAGGDGAAQRAARGGGGGHPDDRRGAGTLLPRLGGRHDGRASVRSKG
jgi:site-specific DNA recombinase